MDIFLGLTDRDEELRGGRDSFGSIEADEAILGVFRLFLGSSYLK